MSVVFKRLKSKYSIVSLPFQEQIICTNSVFFYNQSCRALQTVFVLLRGENEVDVRRKIVILRYMYRKLSRKIG